ncbi:MAG: UPF0223 family protein, partial [Lentilactobacillus hilgardii]
DFMNDDYSYPLIDGLSNGEVIILVTFFQRVEEAYEKQSGVDRESFMNAYQDFVTVVPSKMEQKQLEKQFQERSGYNAYQVIRQAKQDVKTLKMNEA